MLSRLRRLSHDISASLRFIRDAVAIRRRYGGHVRYIICNESTNELERWSFKTEEQPRLTIVVATYQQELALDCLLKSSVCQTLQNFKVLVIHDGPSQTTPSIVSACSRERPGRFDYLETPDRLNDFGHSLRAVGIDKSSTEFILLTNGDNYYAPRFVEFMFEAIDTHNLDIAFCDMIHSYTYGLLRTRPFRNYINSGCFIAKTDAAKSVGFRDKSFSGDATYFEDLLNYLPTPAVGKVRKVLMVHN